MPVWHVYICDRGGQLYTGITTDIPHRMRQHGAELLYSEEHPDKHAAARREKEIKGWGRARKLALIRGEVSLP
jgi:putative endonuclease